jgi:hypothetical protein
MKSVETSPAIKVVDMKKPRSGESSELCGFLLQDGQLDWPCRS